MNGPGLRDLQVLRLKLHRLQPARPLRDARAAAAFVRGRRLVLAVGRSSLPMLAEAIIGAPLAGSWMAHPQVFRIHRILGGLRRYRLPAAPLILGRETIFDPSLGPAVERLAGDPARRAAVCAHLPPLARRLLDEVEEKGLVRMDQWTAPAREARRARLLLVRHLLVQSLEAHTAAGYHTAMVRPWTRSVLAKRFSVDAARMTLEEALDEILLAAVRSAVLAPEREVRRWLPASRDRVEALARRGALTRIPGGGSPWLTCPQ